ncbi:MAG: SurA N-terminal domain-containing protein [Planctomycetes bacterium]|nr:SurA N-terminal domain-containing protein [Planctomycetota bacterium]
MRIWCVIGVLLCWVSVCVAGDAVSRGADGGDEVLVVVNGKAITYEEIVGGMNLQAEINALRATRRVPPEVTDKDLERQLVHQRLRSVVLGRLLEAEADAIQMNISDTQMRLVLLSERKRLGLREDDEKAWAAHVKQYYGLTPTEYLARRRREMRQQQVLYLMCGHFGPVVPQHPVTVYFSLSVTPRDVREAFEEERKDKRVARNIDFREFRLRYPQETSLENRQKLLRAIEDPEVGVYPRVEKGESLEAACEGLEKLLADSRIPGAKLTLSERRTARDSQELGALQYDMVLSVPATGGISKVGADQETDEEGAQFEVITFVQVFSRQDGDLLSFEDPKVQEGLRRTLYNRRLAENQTKVEQALLKRAALVPEQAFRR